jgi:hypothetical protein
MGEELSGEKRVDGPRLLSRGGLVGLVIAFCVGVPLASALSEEVGEWPGVAVWLVAWGAMAVVAATVTYRYDNSFLPTLCGALIGASAPRPSDEWLRQLAGEGVGRALPFALSLVTIGIGIAVFSMIATRSKASPSASPKAINA